MNPRYLKKKKKKFIMWKKIKTICKDRKQNKSLGLNDHRNSYTRNRKKVIFLSWMSKFVLKTQMTLLDNNINPLVIKQMIM